MSNQRNVDLVGILKHPTETSWSADDYPTAGAMGCFDERASAQIHKDHKVDGIPYGPEKLNWDETKEVIMRETSGRGHGAVLDQSAFVFSIDNLSRASTLFLCGPQYASHLQQSLRRATAERGFVESQDPEANQIMDEQFALYQKMVKAQLPTEDARIILPLNTKTTIQSMWNARELMHLKSLAGRMIVPSGVSETIDEMYSQAETHAPNLMENRAANYEVLSWLPGPQLFAPSNSSLDRLIQEDPTMRMTSFSTGIRMSPEEVKAAVEGRDEAALANLKHYHFSFLAPMSLMTHHQATRQRTWDQTVEPLSSAIMRGVYVVPPSIEKSQFGEEFRGLTERSIKYAIENNDNPDAYGVLPHSLEVGDLIHVNGWNAIHSIGKRTCTTAQWEIRSIAKYMAKEIRQQAPEVGAYSLPQGMIYGSCPERENCGACKKQ